MGTHVFHFSDEAMPIGRRKTARVRLALPGKAVLITGHEPCRFEDLSQTGACATVAGMAPPIGDDVVLIAQGVEVFGKVVWRQGSRFGVSFDRPLAKAQVVRLRTIHDHFQMLEKQQSMRRARDFVQGRRV